MTDLVSGNFFSGFENSVTHPDGKKYTRNGMPWNWWKDTKGTLVNGFDHYKQFMMIKDKSPNAKKHVFLDFYMKECPYCKNF